MSQQLTIVQELEVLGSGAFGVVKKVKCSDGQIRAAKFFKSSDEWIKKELEAEKNLFRLNHKNILKFVALIEIEGKPVLIMELISGETLEQRLKRTDRFSEGTVKDFARQICSGLAHMHTQNPPVIHRDLKGANIMVTNDNTVKLIDFGLSHQLESVLSGQWYGDLVYAGRYFAGTPCFMAPELFTNRQYSTHSDVWAFGCTIYEMLAGMPPYSDQVNTMEQLIKLIKTKGAPDLPSNVPDELRDFYKQCTQMRPGDRSSARQLLQHPFLR